MRRLGGGVILVTGSTNQWATRTGLGSYTASKNGLTGLVQAAALENAGHGIRVVALSPGMTDTPMLDVHRPAGLSDAQWDQMKAQFAQEGSPRSVGWPDPRKWRRQRSPSLRPASASRRVPASRWTAVNSPHCDTSARPTRHEVIGRLRPAPAHTGHRAEHPTLYARATRTSTAVRVPQSPIRRQVAMAYRYRGRSTISRHSPAAGERTNMRT